MNYFCFRFTRYKNQKLKMQYKNDMWLKSVMTIIGGYGVDYGSLIYLDRWRRKAVVDLMFTRRAYFRQSVPEGGSSRQKVLLGTGVVDGWSVNFYTVKIIKINTPSIHYSRSSLWPLVMVGIVNWRCGERSVLKRPEIG